MAEYLVLFSGEKDGFTKKIAAAPQVFFAVPNCDDGKLKGLRGKILSERIEELSVLAYKLRPDSPRKTAEGDLRYLYDRAPELDKVRHH